MRKFLATSLSILLSVLGAGAVDVDLAYVDDITELTSLCYVRAIQLKAVEDFDDEGSAFEALDGVLELADGSHGVRIANGSGNAALWVGLKGSSSPVQAEWERVLVDGTLLASVQLQLSYADGVRAPYRLFLMWNPLLPELMTFCRDSYREASVAFGDLEARVAVVDADTDGRYDILDRGVLLIDTDGDGQLLATGDSHERFVLDEPFNIDGTSYVIASISVDGSRMRVEESSESVPPKAPILPGFSAPDFSATDSRGEALTLSALRGDVVVLDFWAGWCGYCIAELPTLKELVAEFGERGVALLGINLDRSVGAFENALSGRGIDWRQVYDGSGGAISNLYRIEGIPMTYLIDRNGVIVARGLRGQALLDAVTALIADVEGAEE